MYIEVKGIDFSNAGAELMLLSIIKALDYNTQNYKLVIAPSHIAPYSDRARLGAWQKFSFKKLGIEWAFLGNHIARLTGNMLDHFGIVPESKIDLVLDASGFIYSEQWPISRMQDTLEHIHRVKRNNGKYIFLPQAFGPFTEANRIKCMQDIIENADLLIARDEQSFDVLRKIGRSQKITLYPDFTPTLEPSAPSATMNQTKQYVCIVPNAKMVLKEKKTSRNDYLKLLENVVNYVISIGLDAMLINHGGLQDDNICRELVDRSGNVAIYCEENNPLVLKGVIGKSKMCVSSRFHACVNALSQGVPTVATSWSHKYEYLFKYYGCEEYIIKISESKSAVQAIIQCLLSNHDTISQELMTQSFKHKEEISAMWQEIFAEIE